MQEILIGFLKFLLGIVNALFPSIHIDDSGKVSAALEFIKKSYDVLNFLLPLKTIFTIIGIVVAVNLVRFTIFVVNWVVKRVRGG